MKGLLTLIILLFGSYLFSSTDYDKEIIVNDASTTRDDKVKVVFSKLMQHYEEENLDEFFDLVSEEEFIQDYITFYEAVDNDFEQYDILDFDNWIGKITADGVKRYLYVKWEKRYETSDGGYEATQRGYSRFLFDEINGQYKLIELAGNNLWGVSLPDWTQEVPPIAGQERVIPQSTQENNDNQDIMDPEPEDITSDIIEPEPKPEDTPKTEQEPEPEPEPIKLPDLTIYKLSCNNSTIEFYLQNNGQASTSTGSIDYSITLCNDTECLSSQVAQYSYSGDIAAGSSIPISKGADCNFKNIVEVDYNDYIDEEDESNNQSTIN